VEAEMGQSIFKHEIVKCEDLINRLGGVIASKIVEDETGEITEVHVLISKDRHPKQISKDVQTVLATCMDKKIDYRCISIAQTGIHNIYEICRINFQSVNTRISKSEIFVEVELVRNKEVFKASACGVNSQKNADRVTVNATIQCIKGMMSSNETLLLEDIDVVQLSKRSVMMVAINIVDRVSEDLVVGSAVLRDDRKESLVRATLDAVNRKLNILL